MKKANPVALVILCLLVPFLADAQSPPRPKAKVTRNEGESIGSSLAGGYSTKNQEIVLGAFDFEEMVDRILAGMADTKGINRKELAESCAFIVKRDMAE